MDAAEFQVGDVVITRSTGTSHCGIVAWYDGFDLRRDKNNPKADDIVHAQGTGINTTQTPQWGALSDVYRPVDLTRDERIIVDKIANQFRLSTKYSIPRAMFKSLGSASFGSGARDRLAKYRERMKTRSNQGWVSNVFCSELVTLCYQIGFPEDHRLFIKLDAQKTWPSTLRTYLGSNPQWQYMGTFPE